MQKLSTVMRAAALLAATLATAAQAQTGRPSEAPDDHAIDVSPGTEEPGSYARYLMLNGKPRDEAIKAAWNIDHPAPSKRDDSPVTAPQKAAAALPSVERPLA